MYTEYQTNKGCSNWDGPFFITPIVKPVDEIGKKLP